MSKIPPEDNENRLPDGGGSPGDIAHGGLGDAEWEKFVRWFDNHYFLEDVDLLDPDSLRKEIRNFRAEQPKSGALPEHVVENIEERQKDARDKAEKIVGDQASPVADTGRNDDEAARVLRNWIDDADGQRSQEAGGSGEDEDDDDDGLLLEDDVVQLLSPEDDEEDALQPPSVEDAAQKTAPPSGAEHPAETGGSAASEGAGDEAGPPGPATSADGRPEIPQGRPRWINPYQEVWGKGRREAMELKRENQDWFLEGAEEDIRNKARYVELQARRGWLRGRRKAKQVGVGFQRKFSDAVHGYRTKRARWKKTGHALDRGVRGVATGGAATGLSSLTGLQFFQNWLNVGGAITSGIANTVSIGMPVLPLAYRPVCMVYAKWRHDKEQQDAFRKCETEKLGMNKGEVEANEEAFQWELGQPTVELINEPGEQQILEAFHAMMRDHLADVPHFVTEERYAQYCFTRLAGACEAASAKVADNRSDTEQKLLGAVGASYSNGEITHVRQVAIAYGKMLAERERRETECYTTGAIVGASAGLVLTYGPLAPVVGGAAWIGRKLWRNYKEKQVHIEINERNEIVGKNGQPIYNPTTYRSDVASLYRRGDFVAKAEDEATRKEWHEEEGVKSWLKVIVIPAECVQRCRTGAIKTPRELALEAASRVQDDLHKKKVKKLPKKAPEAKIAQLKEELMTAKEELKERRQARDKVRGDLRAAEIGVQESQNTIQQYATTTDFNEKKARTEAKRMLKLHQSRAARARGELPDLEELVQKQEEVAKKLSTELRQDEHPEAGEELTLEKIGDDIEIGKAFAVAVVEIFQANAKQGWVRKKTGEALAPVSSAAKEAAVEVVVKPVIIGGAAVGGVFLAGKLIGFIGGFAVSTPVTLMIGGAVGIYALVRTVATAIKEFKWGKGAKEEKKEPEKK
ncbi:MAG: hypothetical protein V1876_02650 [Candidatus Peregrinibacteria bacterium]